MNWALFINRKPMLKRSSVDSSYSIALNNAVVLHNPLR
jgi:hypothetical protein